jgi:hypothetical protein
MYKRNSGEPSLIFSKSAFFFASFHPSFSRHIKKEGKQKKYKKSSYSSTNYYQGITGDHPQD